MNMQHFRTHDLSLAAALLHEKCRLIDLDRSAIKVQFLFEDSMQLQEVVSRYWRDDLLCPAQSLLASFRKAKHILHDYRP
jgi:hypothetical protein